MLKLCSESPRNITINLSKIPQAEVIVVNTCSFINDSKKESINTVLELSENKKSGVCNKLIVTGCLPQRYKEDLKAAFPEVDAFVGTGQYGRILDFIEGQKESEEGFKHPKYLHNENTQESILSQNTAPI